MCTVPGTRKAYELRKEAAAMELETQAAFDPASFEHIPVLLNECLEGLSIDPAGTYLDGTAGGAGHSRAIAERLTTGQLLSFDRDPDAVAEATKRLAPYPAAEVIHSEFARIPEVLAEKGIEGVDGILLDLGVSSYQLDNPERENSERSYRLSPFSQPL